MYHPKRFNNLLLEEKFLLFRTELKLKQEKEKKEKQLRKKIAQLTRRSDSDKRDQLKFELWQLLRSPAELQNITRQIGNPPGNVWKDRRKQARQLALKERLLSLPIRQDFDLSPFELEQHLTAVSALSSMRNTRSRRFR